MLAVKGDGKFILDEQWVLNDVFKDIAKVRAIPSSVNNCSLQQYSSHIYCFATGSSSISRVLKVNF